MKIKKNSEEAILIKNALIKHKEHLADTFKNEAIYSVNTNGLENLEAIGKKFNKDIYKIDSIISSIYESSKICADDIPF